MEILFQQPVHIQRDMHGNVLVVILWLAHFMLGSQVDCFLLSLLFSKIVGADRWARHAVSW